MSPWYYPLILLLILIPIAAAVALYFFFYKRRKEMQMFAENASLSFEADAARLPSFEGSGFGLFDQGHARKSSNLVVSFGGGAERVYFFDYSYVTGTGNLRRVHRFTPACFEFLGTSFPRFELRPENFLQSLGEPRGFADIALEGYPGFARRYRLAGADAEAVKTLFTPKAAAYLEQHPGWRIQGGGTRIVLFGKEGLIPPQMYKAYMDEAVELVSILTAR